MTAMSDDELIPLKLSFSSGESSATLDYVEFRKVCGGTKEIQISTVPGEALRMVFTLSIGKGTATAEIATNFPRNSVQKVTKACQVLKVLEKGCKLEIFSLRFNTQLCVLHTDPLRLASREQMFVFIDDLSTIATRLETDFVLPDSVELSSGDEQTFVVLRAFATDVPLSLKHFTAKVVKSAENREMIAQQLGGRDGV